MDEVNTKRLWTEPGSEYTRGENRPAFSLAFDHMVWNTVGGEGISVGVVLAEAFLMVKKEFKLKRISHVAISNEMEPLVLLGVRTTFPDGNASLYVAQEEDGLTLLAVDLTPFIGVPK